MSSALAQSESHALLAADLQLLRLLRLASPMLPVGAFSYSQGLEAAVELGWIRDEATAGAWIGEVLAHSVATFEAPIWVRVYRSFLGHDEDALVAWNNRLLAGRETHELRAESAQMGHALRRLMEDSREFDTTATAILRRMSEVAFTTAFAVACAQWSIGERAGLTGYLWSWLENQVAAAMKIVPLGQLAGQRLLAAMLPRFEVLTNHALSVDDDALSSFAPGLAIAASAHEVQYSRLFRS